MIFRLQTLSLGLLAVLLTQSTDMSLLDAAEIATPDSSVVGQAQQDELLQLVNSAIDITSRRYLSGDVHTPWQLMHGLLALRRDFTIKVDGEKVNGLQWLTDGRLHNGLPLVEHSPYGGRFHPFTEPYAFEGHPNQFLAILTMSDLSADFEFKTNVSGTVTIEDMLRNAQMEVNDREEITWTLWALSRYLPIDSQWTNKVGEPWSIERLVQIQTYASPNDAACGGTHGLFALSLARNAALANGQPLRGIWFEADQKIRSYVAQAKSLQNSDGSLSAKYFAGPGYSPEFGKRLATSGHVLEFLMVGARDADLESEWLRNAIRSVAKDLIDHRRTAADCGPLYHALHALVLYQQRMGASKNPADESQPAERLAQAAPDETADAAGTGAGDGSVNTDEQVAEKVDVVEPEQVFVTPDTPTPVAVTESSDELSKDDVADADSDRTAPEDETAASIPSPAETDEPVDGIRGLFDPVDPGDNATTEDGTEAAVIEETEEAEAVAVAIVEAVSEEGTVEDEPLEVARSPEDNAPEVLVAPLVMEDGHVVPMPPTMD